MPNQRKSTKRPIMIWLESEFIKEFDEKCLDMNTNRVKVIRGLLEQWIGTIEGN
jgi:hypothetical protein